MIEFLNAHPIVGILLGIVALAWLVLFLLLPLIVEGIRGWTVKSHRELRDISAKLDALHALLSERGSAAERDATRPTPPSRGRLAEPGGPVPPSAPPAARREPTISDFEVDLASEERKRKRPRG